VFNGTPGSFIDVKKTAAVTAALFAAQALQTQMNPSGMNGMTTLDGTAWTNNMSSQPVTFLPT
jgi:hypothetical protein